MHRGPLWPGIPKGIDMSSDRSEPLRIKTFTPHLGPVPRGAAWIGAAAARVLRGCSLVVAMLRVPPASGQDLRALAREVESDQPTLAAELRGIALHSDALQRSAR